MRSTIATLMSLHVTRVQLPWQGSPVPSHCSPPNRVNKFSTKSASSFGVDGGGGEGGGAAGGNGGGGGGGSGGGAEHVETEPDTPVRLIANVQTDEPLRTYKLGPTLPVLLWTWQLARRALPE